MQNNQELATDLVSDKAFCRFVVEQADDYLPKGQPYVALVREEMKKLGLPEVPDQLIIRVRGGFARNRGVAIALKKVIDGYKTKEVA